MDRTERETMARQWLAANLRWSATLDRLRADHRRSGCVVALPHRDGEALRGPEREHRVA
jgi:hypothetical protein